MRAHLATWVLLLACALGAPSAAWAGPCDRGCGPKTRKNCLANCAKKKDPHTAQVCNAQCEKMMGTCKPVCEAALKHRGRPAEMQAAVKEVLASQPKKR